MKLGIFAKTFSRPTVDEVFDAVIAHGLDTVQFNLACAGLPTLPDALDLPVVRHIRSAAASRGIEMAAISATYNMIHPDLQVREAGLRGLRTVAAACHDLGTSVMTLCTGSRHPTDMWHWHHDNLTSEAWADLLQAMEAALTIAEEAQVTLAIEPERANVIFSAQRGFELLQAMQSTRLKIIIDPANLIALDDDPPMSQVLDEAFDLLGSSIIIAHAKDRAADDSVRPAGKGMVDFERYLELLRGINFNGPVIMHGLAEDEVDGAVHFLSDRLYGK